MLRQRCMQEAMHPLLHKCTHNLRRRRMDYAERYPRWQRLSLELPTEDAVSQTKRTRYSMQRMQHKQKSKKKQKKNVAKQHFVTLSLLIQGSKTLLELNQRKKKKRNQKSIDFSFWNLFKPKKSFGFQSVINIYF